MQDEGQGRRGEQAHFTQEMRTIKEGYEENQLSSESVKVNHERAAVKVAPSSGNKYTNPDINTQRVPEPRE